MDLEETWIIRKNGASVSERYLDEWSGRRGAVAEHRLRSEFMRIASAGVVALIAAVSCSALTACSAPVPTQTTRRAGTNNGSSSKDTAGTNEDELTPANDETDDTTQPPPDTTPPDGDGDGVPDATDCDPASAAVAGTKLLDDGLASDKGYFGAPDGFPQASWAYDGTVYRQTRVVDAADTSFFLKDAMVGDVTAEVLTASTEVAAITPRLRQMFIVVGATVSGGQLSALGCGIEVVGGEATEQKTSVVRLTGAPGAVSTTPLQRVNRAPVQIDEQLSIKARLVKGTLTCDVTNGGVTTTATASGLGTPSGSVGFFTRQTKALFKQARICKLK